MPVWLKEIMHFTKFIQIEYFMAFLMHKKFQTLLNDK